MTIAEIISLSSSLLSILVMIVGFAANNKLNNYRLDKVEEKLDKHNHFMERLAKVEYEVEHLIENKIEKS